MYLVFDTETTGLPKNWKAPMSEVDNWPRVIQLAWALFNEKREMVQVRCDLIKPDGWVIPKEKFWIDNGFDQFTSLKNGIPIDNALDAFIEALEQSNYLIAHNMNFDHNIVGAEMLRRGKSTAYKTQKVCTMEASTPVLKLRGRFGDFKWPKLEELHRYLFSEMFENAHDAGADVKACGRCFFELVDRKHIKLQEASL